MLQNLSMSIDVIVDVDVEKKKTLITSHHIINMTKMVKEGS